MRVRFLPALAAVLCLATGAARAQAPFYVSGSLGGILPGDISGSTTIFNALGNSGPGTNTWTYDAGPQVNLALGYQLPFGFRVEGELGYAHYTADSVSPLSTNGAFPSLNGSRLSRSSGGGHALFSGTLNLFYDLPVQGMFVPYIGGGAGYYHESVDAAHFQGFSEAGGSVSNAVVMGEAGVTIKLSAGLALVPAYRFEHLFGSSKQAVNANIFKVGLRYTF